MTEDDKDARKARAAALKKQIARLTKPGAAPEKAKPESPRKFVERRMRELDRKDEEKPRKT